MADTYAVAGTSVAPNSGVKTYRFTNTAMNLRANMLRHKGHEKINLIELPRPMSQRDAIVFLLTQSKGHKGAVIATRSEDKRAKSDVVVEAETLVAKRAARQAAKTEKLAA